jgi:hypothetical protein
MRRAALEKLHHLLDAKIRRQVHQGVDMFGIHIVDFHIDALFRSVSRKVGGNLHGCRFGN